MSSLQAHVQRHDVAANPLAFRRDCPLCRAERVQGHLPSASLMPARARAAVAAALLAASSVVPGAAVAADGQGVAAPAPAAPPPPQASDLTVGEGGAAPVERDHDAGSEAAEARGHDSDGAQQSERWPEVDAGAHDPAPAGGGRSNSRPTPTHDDGAIAGTGEAPSEEPARGSDPRANGDTRERPADTGPPAAPAPASGDGHAAAPTDSAPDPDHGESSPLSPTAPASASVGTTHTGGDPQERHGSRSGRSPSPGSDLARGDRGGAPDANRSSGQAGRTARDGGLLVANANSAGSGMRSGASRQTTEPPATYHVSSGDSLWRIAERQLGSSATVAAIAQEVTRLWELNRHRIGTGNPDLIFPGQTLRI
jgi:LysM repeat protein